MALTPEDKEWLSEIFELKLAPINTHLEFTDGRVDRLELSINGDPNNLVDHPGMAGQVKQLCEGQAKIDKYKGAIFMTGVLAACGWLWKLVPTLFAASEVQKVKP